MFRFRFATTLARCDLTGRSRRSRSGSCALREDSYLTHNNLVQQATLPSTGLTTHNNYWNTVISNTYAFSPTWLGTFVFDASELHLTQTRNSTLGFALAFPFSATSLTVSGFETYGDNQFATPITFFPVAAQSGEISVPLRRGPATGDHSFRFGVNFIHEPVLSGAFPGNQETLYTFPEDPSLLRGESGAVLRSTMRQELRRLPRAMEASRRMCSGLACTRRIRGGVSRHLTLNYGLRWQTTFGLFTALGTQPDCRIRRF